MASFTSPSEQRMDEIVIKVTFDPDNGGYSYYVYDGHDSYMECEELDGGVCTTTLEALNMAVDAAREMLSREA